MKLMRTFALLLAFIAAPAFADCVLRQSTAVDMGIGPFVDSTDGVTAETGLTLTQPDIRLKKNGGAWAQKNAAQTLSHEEAGWYEVSLDTTDTNTVGLLIIAVAESGALPVWEQCQVVEEAVYDRDFAASATGIVGTAQTGDAYARLGAPAGASIAADLVVIDDFVDNLETRVGTPSDLGGGATVAANLADIEGQTDDIGVAGAGLNALPDVDTLLEALVTLGAEQTADSGTTTTVVDAALTQGTDGWFSGQGIHFTSGTLLGEDACVTGFTASGDTLTFTPAVTTAVTTHTYYLLPSTGCEALVRIGAAGASLTAIPWNAAWDAEVESEVDDSIGGGTGTSLTAIPWNAAWDAEVQSEANDALVANFLDYLFNADYNPASKPGNAGGIINELVENDAGATRYTSEALELAPTAGGGNMTQIEGVDATDAIDARIAAANVLRPTTAGRTLDVTAGGNAGIDLDNISLTNASPATGIGASGTLSGTHSTTTADLGSNAPGAAVDVVGRTLDVFTSGGVPKFSVTITSYDSSTGVATFSTVTTAGVNGDLWYLWDTATGSGATDVNVVTVESTDATTYFSSLDDATVALIGTPVDLGVGGANLADNLQEIESQTDDIGTAGAGLTSAGITAAGVRSALGFASANADTQLSAIAGFIDTEVATAVSQTTGASMRGNLGLGSANLDTQLANIESGVDIDTIEGTDASDLIDARITAAGLATAASQTTIGGYIDTEITQLLNARTQIIPAADADGILTADSGDTNTLVDTELTFANDVDIDGAYVVRSDGQRCFIDSFSAASDTIEFGACTFTGAWSTQTYKIYPAGTQ